MQQHRIIMSAFLLQPLAFGSCLPRIPDIQQALSLGSADLAVSLLGMPTGVLLSLPIGSKLLARLGYRLTFATGFLSMLLTLSLAMWSSSQLMLFFALALVGATNTLLLLSLNAVASQYERQKGALILNTCHGFGSVGLMIGSLLGSILAAFNVPYPWAVFSLVLLILPFAVVLIRSLAAPAVMTNSSHNVEKKRTKTPSVLPSWKLLSICLFAFGIALTEGAMADWSAIYLREHFSATAGAAGLGFTVFAALVALGRFTGDFMKLNFGAMLTTKLSTLVALAGMLALLVAPNTLLVYGGFAMLGFGVSVGFPMAVSAAAAHGNQDANSNIATLTFFALLGFMAGPPMIGFVAEYSTVQYGLAMLIPILLISFVMTGSLDEPIKLVQKRA